MEARAEMMLRMLGRLFCAVGLGVAALSAGCSVRQVELPHDGMVMMSPQNSPLTQRADGHGVVRFDAKFTGKTQVFLYDNLAWAFARMPCVRSDSGTLIMLDTGMNFPAHVTMDVVVKNQLPAHLGAPIDVAYVPGVKLGPDLAKGFPAQIDSKQWVLFGLGMPMYRARGWTFGSPILSKSEFLAFDSRLERVTIGFDKFQEDKEHKWISYAMPPNRIGVPMVTIPVAGKDMTMLADSAGGPRLILNKDDWDKISSGVVVEKTYKDDYPSWQGSQTMDVYVVKKLTFGPLKFEHEPVWVRNGAMLEQIPGFGLGLLKRQVAVWDFGGGKFWIGY